ncbi:MAG TPA: FHA domain-containing protein [Candidatus Binataceae bacterium]|nr:FHA domain-containing protein [Candidatus Binataceae bacterium]
MPVSKSQAELRLIGLGEMSPGEHRFALAQIAVGNGVGNDFVIAHPTVSRKHALLRYDTGAYVIEDLASTNGTFVNRRRIEKPTRITPGDEIGFGGTRFAVARIGAGPAIVPRHRVAKTAAAIVGIVLFALAGFVGARYVVEQRRSASTMNHAHAAPTRLSNVGGPTPAASNEEIAGEEASPEATAIEGEVGAAPLWLNRLNGYRAAAGLAAVASDANLSAGDHDHAVYLLSNFASDIRASEIGAQVHVEDVHLPDYTPQGAEAARSSDVAEQIFNGKHPDPQLFAIDGWMTTPFHRLPILNPLLRSVGFGFQCENNMCVELLNIMSGIDPMPAVAMPLEHAIVFPPDGSTIPVNMRAFEGEWPTPISGCDGYAYPVGIAITVQLGPMVDAQLDSFTLAGADGATLEACGFDANSYRNPNEDDRVRVVGGLRSQGAVVIVPRHPLEPGPGYDVVATINGRDYKWSFGVAHE